MPLNTSYPRNGMLIMSQKDCEDEQRTDEQAVMC